MKENFELVNLKLRICKVKVVEFFIYLAIAITLILTIVFKWELCRHIACMSMAVVALGGLVAENLVYQNFVFSCVKEDEKQ